MAKKKLAIRITDANTDHTPDETAAVRKRHRQIANNNSYSHNCYYLRSDAQQRTCNNHIYFINAAAMPDRTIKKQRGEPAFKRRRSIWNNSENELSKRVRMKPNSCWFYCLLLDRNARIHNNTTSSTRSSKDIFLSSLSLCKHVNVCHYVKCMTSNAARCVRLYIHGRQ